MEDVTETVDVADLGGDKATKSKAGDGGDTVEFAAGSFSTFVVAGLAAEDAGIRFSASEIMSRLSPVLPFAVFANIFHLTGSEIEGCIAANQAEINGDFGIKNNPSNYLSRANTITVNKTYTGTTQKTFRFGLFRAADDTSAADQNGDHIKEPTLSGGETGTVVFTVDDVDNYTVHELKDESDGGGIINVGDAPYNGFTLTKREQGVKAASLNMNSISYIRSFISIDRMNCHLNDLKSPFPPPYNKLIAGAGTVEKYNQGWQIKYGNGSIDSGNYPDPDKNFVVVDPNDFPIDFDDVFNKMETLSRTSLRRFRPTRLSFKIIK